MPSGDDDECCIWTAGEVEAAFPGQAELDFLLTEVAFCEHGRSFLTQRSRRWAIAALTVRTLDHKCLIY